MNMENKVAILEFNGVMIVFLRKLKKKCLIFPKKNNGNNQIDGDKASSVIKIIQ